MANIYPVARGLVVSTVNVPPATDRLLLSTWTARFLSPSLVWQSAPQADRGVTCCQPWCTSRAGVT